MLNVVEWFSSGVIGLLLVGSILQANKSKRDDKVAEESIEAMRVHAEEFAMRLSDEYDTSLEEMGRRILELGGFFGAWVYQLAYVAGVIHQNVNDENRKNSGT